MILYICKVNYNNNHKKKTFLTAKLSKIKDFQCLSNISFIFEVLSLAYYSNRRFLPISFYLFDTFRVFCLSHLVLLGVGTIIILRKFDNETTLN